MYHNLEDVVGRFGLTIHTYSRNSDDAISKAIMGVLPDARGFWWGYVPQYIFLLEENPDKNYTTLHELGHALCMMGQPMTHELAHDPSEESVAHRLVAKIADHLGMPPFNQDWMDWYENTRGVGVHASSADIDRQIAARFLAFQTRNTNTPPKRKPFWIYEKNYEPLWQAIKEELLCDEPHSLQRTDSLTYSTQQSASL